MNIKDIYWLRVNCRSFVKKAKTKIFFSTVREQQSIKPPIQLQALLPAGVCVGMRGRLRRTSRQKKQKGTSWQRNVRKSHFRGGLRNSKTGQSVFKITNQQYYEDYGLHISLVTMETSI